MNVMSQAKVVVLMSMNLVVYVQGDQEVQEGQRDVKDQLEHPDYKVHKG